MSDAPPDIPKKPRSPVERALVWGGIAILLVMLAIQANACLRFSQTKNPLLAAVKESDDTDKVVTEEMVKAMIQGKPAHETGAPEGNLDVSAKRMDTYTWKGIFFSYAIKVYYGVGEPAEVVSIE